MRYYKVISRCQPSGVYRDVGDIICLPEDVGELYITKKCLIPYEKKDSPETGVSASPPLTQKGNPSRRRRKRQQSLPKPEGVKDE